MRIIASILAFYFFALMAMPCADIGHSCEKETEEDIALIDQHSSEHSDDSDDCPPFCSCSCCGSNVLLDLFTTNENIRLQFQPSQQFLYNQLHKRVFVTSVFQPPQTL